MRYLEAGGFDGAGACALVILVDWTAAGLVWFVTGAWPDG